MIRRLATTAIADRYRDKCALVTSLLLALTAGVLLVMPAREQTDARGGQQTSPPTTASRALTPARAVRPAVPSASVARRFLAGYLPFLYGDDSRPALPHSSSSLRARLLAQPPVTSASLHDCHPRLASLRLVAVGDGEARALATVADGDVRYPIVLSLKASQGRWEVTGVAGE